MALEYSTFGNGATVFPLTPSTTNTFLKDADPSVYWCLEFFEHVINRYVGTRLVAEADACGAPLDYAVAYALPDSPQAYLTEEQARFPLLAIERVKDSQGWSSNSYRHAKNEWRLHYVLPPLSPGQRERLKPALRVVARTIDSRIEAGCDSQWNNNARVFGPAYANLESIECSDVTYGDWDAGGGLTFPAVTMSLLVVERDIPQLGAFEDLTDTALEEQIVEFPKPGAVSGITSLITSTLGPANSVNPSQIDEPLTFLANCQATDVPGDLVYVSSPPVAGMQQVTRVDPTDFEKMPAVGVLVSKQASTLCTVCYFGVLPMLGLTSTGRLFVGRDGRLTPTPPTGPIFLQVFGVSFQAEQLLVRPSFEMVRLI